LGITNAKDVGKVGRSFRDAREARQVAKLSSGHYDASGAISIRESVQIQTTKREGSRSATALQTGKVFEHSTYDLHWPRAKIWWVDEGP